ncbi:hypothetical protein EDD18DRAFT_1462892 [Armillaria luteobubalina]|uniref:Uncharacterized protein n=1 Tax=Armillaria luteobubalina TaxID=153913 RepID=A0AA39UT94_9AGAR|nr:hypothetical protein EDD18DRAFT_1462892 [Armillaria luteobubalina]
MSAPETATKFAPTQPSVLGGQIVGRTERAAAPPAALKLRLDLNLEVEIAIQAKVNGDITLSLLDLGDSTPVLSPSLKTLSHRPTHVPHRILTDKSRDHDNELALPYLGNGTS